MLHCRAGVSITRYPATGAITATAKSDPDLILIYRKPDDDSLELVRLGSHSELGF